MQVLEIVREHRCKWDSVTGECVTESCDRINTAVRLAARIDAMDWNRSESFNCDGGR
jgi:hypothetical protein